jgi:hypothetical protein
MSPRAPKCRSQRLRPAVHPSECAAGCQHAVGFVSQISGEAGRARTADRVACCRPTRAARGPCSAGGGRGVACSGNGRPGRQRRATSRGRRCRSRRASCSRAHRRPRRHRSLIGGSRSEGLGLQAGLNLDCPVPPSAHTRPGTARRCPRAVSSAARTRPLAPPGWPTHQGRKGASRCYRPKLVGSPLGTRTIQSVHVLLRSALGHAVELELLQVNSTDRIPKDLRPRHKPELAEGKHWEPDQAARFLDSTRDDRWHALWALGLDTGARRGELLALRWSDIDWDGRTVSITRNRVVVNGEVVEGTPKSKRSIRDVDIDMAVPALRRSSATSWPTPGAASSSSPTRSANRSDPTGSTTCSARRARPPLCPTLAPTECATQRRRSCWAPTCRYTSCPNGSGTLTRRSRRRATPTYWSASGPGPPRL